MEKRSMEGMELPGFCLEDQDGKELCSKDLKGSWIVLYLYPKDNTSGCTIEAKDFTCALDDFSKEGAEVIGVSPDSQKSHLNFIGRHDLKLRLLSDPNKELLGALGAWKKKRMYGRGFLGVERSTFLIDPEGKIRRGWNNVKVKGHVDEVLGTLKDLK
ncbi:MAG: peroxiredoxin [Candidatus Thermoplasmatota archaeon]|nr:peroxiredoxin [Candidatus Thermoplasmatota archaeon]